MLFQGHRELIEGYAAFLPPGNTIQVPADPQENILVTMVTGTMEIARDGTVVSETYTGAPKDQPTEAKLPELAEWDKRLLENLQTRIADSEEDKAKYDAFVTSFEAYLRVPPEQRKVCCAGIQSKILCYSLPAKASLGADQGYEFVEKLKELLKDDDEFKKVLSDVSS